MRDINKLLFKIIDLDDSKLPGESNVVQLFSYLLFLLLPFRFLLSLPFSYLSDHHGLFLSTFSYRPSFIFTVVSCSDRMISYDYLPVFGWEG